MAKILLLTGLSFREIELAPLVTIGRTEGNTIAIDDPVIAGEHAQIHRDASGRFVLRDLSTLTGTFIRGERVSGERQLVDGDEIEIGQARLRFMDDRGDTAEMSAMQFEDAPQEPREHSAAFLRELLAEPDDRTQILEKLCDLLDASHVALYLQKGDTLLPYERAKRDHDSSYGPSGTMRSNAFPEVMTSKQPLLVADVLMDARYADDYVIMSCIRSVIVVPVIIGDEAVGIIYAHQTPRSIKDGRPKVVPFTTADLELCVGVAKLVALSVGRSLRSRETLDETMRFATLELLLPPSIVYRVKQRELDMNSARKFAEIYLFHDLMVTRSNAPNPATLAACEAALALSPIERVAVAGRLLESVIGDALVGVDEMVRAALTKE